ncbi:MAG: ABC transporter substrate-binding protein [Actinobacteria bacterium]|nr:ABC transporter substrate-binding protein [Actinomycetota bacterium]
MLTRRWSRSLFGAAVASFLVASACNPFAGDEEEPTTTAPPPTTTPPSPVGKSVDGVLRLGAVLPLSGDLEHFGPGMQAAVELAVDEINDDGGVLGKPVELTVEDSASTADAAAEKAKSLVAGAAVDAIIGPASSAELTGGMLGEAFGGQRVLCSPTASAPRLVGVDTAGLFFAATQNRWAQVEVIANRLKAQGDDRIAVVRDDDADGAALFREFLAEATEAFGDGKFEVAIHVAVGGGKEEDEAEGVTTTSGATSTSTGAGATTSTGAAATTTTVAPAEKAASTREASEKVVAARPEAIVVFELFDAELLPSAGGPSSEDERVAVHVTDSLASEDLANAVDPDRPAILRQVQGVRPRVDAELTKSFDDRLRAETAVNNVDLAARAYECVVWIALAALAADSDDPTLMAGTLVEVTRSGKACANFEACATPILEDTDVRYTGVLNAELNDFGEPRVAVYEQFEFDDEGRISVKRAVDVEVVRDGDAEAGEKGEAPVTTTTAPGATTTSPRVTPTTGKGGVTTTTGLPGGTTSTTTTTTTPGSSTTTSG